MAVRRSWNGETLVSHAEDHEGTRRDFLYYATAGAGVVATGAAVWPLVTGCTTGAGCAACTDCVVCWAFCWAWKACRSLALIWPMLPGNGSKRK